MTGIWNRWRELWRPLRGAHRRTGRRGERVAEAHLRRRGYRVLARNLRTRSGEIDLIVTPPGGRAVVVVEVKAGRAGAKHRPEAHVNAAKRRKLIALATQLVRRHRLQGRPVRFDVVAVEFPPEGQRGAPVVRHHVGAFDVRGVR